MENSVNKNPLHLWFLGWAVTVLTALGVFFGACSTEEFTYLDATFGTSGKVTTDFSSRLLIGATNLFGKPSVIIPTNPLSKGASRRTIYDADLDKKVAGTLW